MARVRCGVLVFVAGIAILTILLSPPHILHFHLFKLRRLEQEEKVPPPTVGDEVLELQTKLNMIQKSELEVAQYSSYWSKRKDSELYTYIVREALSTQEALSALDVGAYESPLLARLTSIPTKVATDQQSRPAVWNHVTGIAFITGDFLSLKFGTTYDVVMCSQVVEHLNDEQLPNFFRKMLSLTRNKLIVSTTHELEFGRIDGHIQDPISSSKFQSWFKMNGTAWADGTPIAQGTLRTDLIGGNFGGVYMPTLNIIGIWTRSKQVRSSVAD